MRYKSFTISNYRAISSPFTVDLTKRIIPFVGVNECGKTTILQAIFCFDETNDKERKGEHLLDIHNLYETDNSLPPKITACIAATPKELLMYLGEYITTCKAKKNIKKEENGGVVAIEENEENIVAAISTFEASLQELSKRDLEFDFEITRNLDEKKYYIKGFADTLPAECITKICSVLIHRLPYILYNDDFNDRPPNKLEITVPAKNLGGWEAIFERVFRSTNSSYSLAETISKDDKTRKSILDDVITYLDSSLTDEWRKFAPKKEKISTDIDIKTDTKELRIMIADELNGKKRFFDISNRSKGFIWYYNFIMKIRFNPKHLSNIKDTVFLLDEPGSYLHETAQTSLCKKLKDISVNEGIVLYCTHSPKLLNPQYIPLNNIVIVEKSSKGYITPKPINEYKTSSQKNSAMQPIYEALLIPEYETITKTEMLICVEGIYDKYAIELFIDLPSDIRIFASVNAESIINNIQYFIVYNKKYIALWDNDQEGKKCQGKAIQVFGTHESNNFMLLPTYKDFPVRRMEEMFSHEDIEMIATNLDLPNSSTYESCISGLFFSGEKKKQIIKKKISDFTKNNFAILSSMIKKHFKLSEEKET